MPVRKKANHYPFFTHECWSGGLVSERDYPHLRTTALSSILAHFSVSKRSEGTPDVLLMEIQSTNTTSMVSDAQRTR
jgi:hypothetical protein